MITVTISRIRLQAGSILNPTPFTLYYKALGDTSWTLLDTNVYVDQDGYILASPFPSFTVVGAGTYIIRAVNDFCNVDYQESIRIYDSGLYEWVEDDNYCEQGTPLNVINSITGFADPSLAAYDSDSGRVYVVDNSAITQGSNIYHFDPDTITSAADVVPVGSLNVAALAKIIDTDARKIYISGPDTGGLIIYDIAADSVNTVLFGSDGSYGRLVLEKEGDLIICVDQVSELVTTVDAVTETVIDNIDFGDIPDYELWFSGSPVVRRINGEWWVMNSQAASYGVPSPNIARYNDDFSALIGVIALSGQVTWDNSAYWRSASLIDNILFVYDMGSNQLLTVDIDTLIVTYIYTFTNRQGKTNSSLTVIRDAVSLEYFISGDWRNTSFDGSPISISYKLDPTTFLPSAVYPAFTMGVNLRRLGSSDVSVGAYAGVLVYPSNPSGAATDGEINLFSKSGSGNNTGTRIVLTLQEVNTITQQPTGNVKPNEAGDPDYIPPYEDLINCPVSYTTLCPTAISTVVGGVAEYEYSLQPSTYNNPSIHSIVLEQVDTVTSTVLNTIAVPKNAYQHGYITKIGSNSNRIDLLFKDGVGTNISTCTNLFTIP